MRCRRLRRAPLAVALASLTSCAAASSSPAPGGGCAALPLSRYTRAQQDAVAAEIAAAPADAAWPEFMAGYGELRAAVRACRSVVNRQSADARGAR